jgi:hypothetical protein
MSLDLVRVTMNPNSCTPMETFNEATKIREEKNRTERVA